MRTKRLLRTIWLFYKLRDPLCGVLTIAARVYWGSILGARKLPNSSKYVLSIFFGLDVGIGITCVFGALRCEELWPPSGFIGLNFSWP